MYGQNWRRWLVKIVTRGALGKHSAVPFAVEDVVIHDLGLPGDDESGPPSGGLDPPAPDQPPGGGIRVAVRDGITEYEIPADGLSFEYGRSRMVHEDGRWVAR